MLDAEIRNLERQLQTTPNDFNLVQSYWVWYDRHGQLTPLETLICNTMEGGRTCWLAGSIAGCIPENCPTHRNGECEWRGRYRLHTEIANNEIYRTATGNIFGDAATDPLNINEYCQIADAQLTSALEQRLNFLRMPWNEFETRLSDDIPHNNLAISRLASDIRRRERLMGLLSPAICRTRIASQDRIDAPQHAFSSQYHLFRSEQGYVIRKTMHQAGSLWDVHYLIRRNFI